MPKKKIQGPNSALKVLGLGVLVIVFLMALYLAYISKDSIQYSPPTSDSTLSYENARDLLAALEKPGIDWYCGITESYKDGKGNNYGPVELKELKRILGNEQSLITEFC